MHYIIDGYNLLFRILTSSFDLAPKRQEFIENLNNKVKLLGMHVTIIFDSNYRLTESPKSHYESLEIQFTCRGVTADEWIIENVPKMRNRERIIVVTSDKRLAMNVRHAVKTESVEQFLNLLNKRIRNKQDAIKLEKSLQNEPIRAAIKLKSKLIKLPEDKEKPKAPKAAKLETSFDYYLQEFEASYKKNAPPEKAPKKKLKQKKHEFPTKPPVKKNSDDKVESEEERWLRLFDSDSNN